MTFLDKNGRRVGSRVCLRVETLGRIAGVVLGGAMAVLPDSVKAGSAAVGGPPADDAGDMKLYPFLVDAGTQFFSDKGTTTDAGGPTALSVTSVSITPASARSGWGDDRPFDCSAAAQPDARADAPVAGYFVTLPGRPKDQSAMRFAVRRAADPGADGGTDPSSGNGGQSGFGGTASVPLPAEIFLVPAGLALAGYGARRLCRRW